MIKDPADYRRDFYWGGEWENRVASLIQRCNPYVEQPQKFNAEVDGKLVGFPDDGDLRAMVQIGCKRRRIQFTCRDDYPYRTVFVDEEYKLIPEHMPHAEYYRLSVPDRLACLRWFHSYWIASADMEYVALVVPATKRHWVLETLYSPKDKRDVCSWACPKEKVIFGKASEIPSLLTWT